MLNFFKLTLDDIYRLKPYFNYSSNQTCDNTVGGTFMWRDFFSTEYALFNDTLIFKVKYFQRGTAFSLPLGDEKNLPASIEEITKYCRFTGTPLVFCMVTEENIKILKNFFDKIEIYQEINWSDYLYKAEDLIYLSGRKFNGQRNHINYFKKTYQDYLFEKIDCNNVNEVKEFYAASDLIDSKSTAIFIEEQNKTFEVLENYGTYGLLGGLLRVNGAIIGFAIGEISKNTLYVHIEKANSQYRGAYQILVNEFAKRYASKESEESEESNGIEFINREEDDGDEGLRISKLSYHPCGIIEKYTATVNTFHLFL